MFEGSGVEMASFYLAFGAWTLKLCSENYLRSKTSTW